ncbi:hypothetical protein ES708_21626 [subsurface metagenome]
MRDITVYKQEEEELKREKEFSGKIINTSNAIIVGLDKNHKIKLFNMGAEGVTGYSKKEVIGKDWFRVFFKPELVDEMNSVWKHAWGTKFHSYINPILNKAGEERIISWQTSGFYEEEDEKKHMLLSIGEDITKMKKAEEALKKSEKKFRNYIESSGDIMYVVDKNLKFLYGNRKYLKRRGLTQKELLGKEYGDFHSDEGKGKFIERVKAVRESGEPIFYEYQSEIDGRYFLRTLSPVIDPETKESESITVISRDITDRKKAETKLKQVAKHEKKRLKELRISHDQLQKSQEASLNLMEDLSVKIEQHKQTENMLRSSEKRYHSLFENIRSGFALHEIVFDKKGKPADYIFLEVNKAFELQTGLIKKDIIGKKVTDVLPGIENDPVNWMQKYGEVVLTGENILFENYAEPLKKWYSVVAYKSQENQFAAIFTDITDRKRSELKIQQSRTQLRKLAAHLEDVREEERTIIARNIHDELGQLATALKMDVSWLQKQLPKENQQWIAKTQTISDLVDMTANEIQRICSELRPGVLDDLGLEDALEWYVSEYNKRTGTVCKLSIEFDLARLNKHLSVAVYRMIQEALTNVRRHAKASKVTISIAGENGKLKIIIKDNGIGITQEQIDDSTSFGLIGIEERALSMNGYSRISGKKGEGTTLVIVLGIGNSSL